MSTKIFAEAMLKVWDIRKDVLDGPGDGTKK
jgi:hypothetical protein